MVYHEMRILGVSDPRLLRPHRGREGMTRLIALSSFSSIISVSSPNAPSADGPASQLEPRKKVMMAYQADLRFDDI